MWDAVDVAHPLHVGDHLLLDPANHSLGVFAGQPRKGGCGEILLHVASMSQWEYERNRGFVEFVGVLALLVADLSHPKI